MSQRITRNMKSSWPRKIKMKSIVVSLSTFFNYIVFPLAFALQPIYVSICSNILINMHTDECWIPQPERKVWHPIVWQQPPPPVRSDQPGQVFNNTVPLMFCYFYLICI